MSNEFAAQLPTEGQPAFPVESKGNENPSDSPAVEKTNIDPTPSPEENKEQVPNKEGNVDEKKPTDDKNLADHPRWQEREKNWTERFNLQEKRHVEELAKFRQEIEAKFSANKPAEAPAEIEMPAWFGGTEEQWKEFVKFNESQIAKAKEQAKSETITEIQSKSEGEKKAIEEATAYMNQEIAAIESDPKLNPTGEKIDKNKLYKLALDFDLVDSNHRWNWKAAYQFYRNQKGQPKTDTINEKKQIAGASIDEKKSDTKPAPVRTTQDFKGKNWGDL